MGCSQSTSGTGEAYQADGQHKAVPLSPRLFGNSKDKEKKVARKDSKAEARWRYTDPDGLLDLFRSGDIRLLRGSWLVQRAGYSFRFVDRRDRTERMMGKSPYGRAFIESTAADAQQLLPYRQQLELEDPAAYLPFRELAKMVKGQACELPALPVVAVSYCWERSQHPDPAGRLLQSVAKGLKDLIEHSTYGDALYYFKFYPDFGVFLDWASVFQKPRSPEQDQSFKHALAGMNLVYAHSRTVPLIVTDQDNFLEVPRSSRGWPCFEEAMSFMLKDRSQVVGGNQGAPLASADFEAVLETLTFTNGADREMVARLYRNGLQEALGAKKDLEFQGTSDALAALGRALQEVAPPSLETVSICRSGGGTSTPGDDLFAGLVCCSNIRQLKVSGLEYVTESIGQLASITELDLSEGSFEELPDTIGRLQSLETLDLTRCCSLKEIPDSIRELKSLTYLNLDDCKCLEELPGTIGNLQSLESLRLYKCKNLKELPAAVGGLSALKELSLNGCIRLTELPAEIGGLSALKELSLNGCIRLTELPDAIGSLSKLEELYLTYCISLRQLPKTICGLPALRRLDLCGCWLLEEMPSAVADMKSLRHLDLSNCPASFRFKVPVRARCTFGGLGAGRLAVKREMTEKAVVDAGGNLRPREEREAEVKAVLDNLDEELRREAKKRQQAEEARAAAAAAAQAKEREQADEAADEAPAAAAAVDQAKEDQRAEEAPAAADAVAQA